ncbi:hypothetical protein EC973_005006 [Apophysomyces ossiformis]|uniref:Large ribosomal subunit protein bL32m n=1 Tax=Apophysomyces ossiformis TaxID=679940 RepID=A0A8H7BPH9_9FUNG|nr:hypothetical protein EC973_005006 [Apophysomyces ossiformis]
MSLRSFARPTAHFYGSLKVQTSRFGTLSLSQATLDSTAQNTFQVPCWLEPVLWAAPKKKTSHSKKRMRASNKGLPLKENVTECPACGNHKLLHHLCKHCYGDIKEKSKNELLQA